MNIQAIFEELHNAIYQYGEYTLFDKGVSEVMDTNNIEKKLKNISPIEGNKFLKEIALGNKDVSERQARSLVSHLLVCVDDLPDAHWEVLIKDIEDLY